MIFTYNFSVHFTWFLITFLNWIAESFKICFARSVNVLNLYCGYTYNGTIIADEHVTVAGGTESLGGYRGSSGHLCLRIHVNTTGYNEGKLHVLFGSHANTVTRNLEVTDVRQRDDGSNAF